MEFGTDLAARSEDADLNAAWQLIAESEQLLALIERTVTSLGDGTYGRCEICGSKIDAQRLSRAPMTLRCGAHQNDSSS